MDSGASRNMNGDCHGRRTVIRNGHNGDIHSAQGRGGRNAMGFAQGLAPVEVLVMPS
jgi:hypothetical protein